MGISHVFSKSLSPRLTSGAAPENFEAAMLQDLVAKVSETTGQELYSNALLWLQRWLKADICFIGQTENGINSICAIQGDSRRQLQVGSQYEIANSPCEQAIRKGFHYVPNKVADCHPHYPSLRALNVEGYAGVPLRDKHGQLLGMLVMLTHGEMQLPDFAQNLLKILAARVSGEMARLRAEATRQETEFFSRAVLDAMPANVCVLDHHGNIIAVNQRWRLFTATEADTAACGPGANYLGTCLKAKRLPEMDARTIRTGIELLLSGRRDTFSHEYTMGGHGKRWFLLIANRFSQGRQSYIILTHLDITDRKEAEAHLRNRSVILDGMISCDWLLHSVEPWQKIMPEVLGMIGIASNSSRVYLFRHAMHETASPGATALHRWTSPDAEPTWPAPLDTLGYAATGCERWQETLSHGQAIFGDVQDFPETERTFLQQHGSLMLTLIPIFSGDDWWGFLALEDCRASREISPHELSALMAAGRSIGVAVQREAANKRLNQAMIAFDSIAEGVVITDENALITAINKGFTEITGYTESEILGQPIHQLRSDQHGKEFYHAIWRVLLKEGRWRGEVWNRRKDGSAYPGWLTITEVTDSDDKAINYVAVFSDISEVRQVEDRLQELVNHDPLTGLPNRRLLNELMGHAIKRAEREQTMIGLLFIDLDRFKTINDSLGHQVGDKLLMEVAARLTGAMRESDAVARLGGDEFVVMVDDLRDIEDATLIAKKIINSLHTEFVIDGKEFFIGASIGISIYPHHGREVDDLLKAADIAMYQVKNEGKNDFRIYSVELSEHAVERFTLESMLRRAMERNQFEVYYQPQISLATGKIVGAEALIRWHHPELGLVSPAKFIPLAEESDLIIQIGEWVLREAALQAMRWSHAGFDLQWISVNVSGVQIQRSNFVDTVYGVLIETDCDPSLLELEITESTIMRNTEYVIGVLDHIKALGLRLAIDDFGTGYSSLSHLKRLPLHKLKIDQSFVHDLPFDTDDAAIARVIQGLGRSLGLSVIAEGVETPEQAEFLLSIGCDEGQGYLYSPPVPADAFTALLEKNKLGRIHTKLSVSTALDQE